MSNAPELELCGTVQMVRVSWTKSSRGFPGSVARSRVPQAFPLSDPGPGPRFELVTCRERVGFEPVVEWTRGLVSMDVWGLFRLRQEQDALLVFADRNQLPSAPPPIRLRGTQWLRWKHISVGRNTVLQTTLNVTSSTDVSADIFLGVPFACRSTRTS